MSSTELVARYLSERSRPSILGLLAVLLTATGRLIAPAPGVSLVGFTTAVVTAFLLVLAFRVWDDVADRERDAIEHPERIMVTSRRVMPFALLGALLVIGALVPISSTADAPMRIAALAVAATCLAIWYRKRPPSVSGSLGGHVVLIKYPAIALAVAPATPAFDTRTSVLRTAATLASLYLILCIYESFDDPALRASTRARRIAITEIAVLIPLIIATASFSGLGLP